MTQQPQERPGLNVHRAEPLLSGPVADLVNEAFHGLDVCRWLFPEARRRAEAFKDFCRLFVDQVYATSGGHIDVVEDDGVVAAAAVWFSGPPETPPGYEDWLGRIGPAAARFRQLDAFMESCHPHDVEHDYLLFLAVDPKQQGMGLGGALLEHHHAALDRLGRPAFLESASARSLPLYKRHGYEQNGPPMTVTARPTMFPMWRAAAV